MSLKKIFTTVVSTITLTTLLASNTFAVTATDATVTAPQADAVANTNVTSSTEGGFTADQVKSIQKIVREYLVANPQVLLEVSAALRKQMEEKQLLQAQDAIKQNKDALFNDSKSPTVGNPQGTKTLVEFFDYQCPHCKEVNTVITGLIAKNKDLKVVMKEWPIFGGASNTAAQAALAAAKQGKYMEMHEALLTAEDPLSADKIQKIAKKLSLNVTQLNKDMKSPEVAAAIKSNFELARNLGLVGTPAFIMTNKNQDQFKFVPGAATEEGLQKQLDELK